MKWIKVGDKQYHSDKTVLFERTLEQVPQYQIIKGNSASKIGGRTYHYWWVETFHDGWYVPEDKFDTLKEAKEYAEKLHKESHTIRIKEGNMIRIDITEEEEEILTDEEMGIYYEKE